MDASHTRQHWVTSGPGKASMVKYPCGSWYFIIDDRKMHPKILNRISKNPQTNPGFITPGHRLHPGTQIAFFDGERLERCRPLFHVTDKKGDRAKRFVSETFP
jgi:hypothetical protein